MSCTACEAEVGFLAEFDEDDVLECSIKGAECTVEPKWLGTLMPCRCFLNVPICDACYTRELKFILFTDRRCALCKGIAANLEVKPL